MKAVIWTKDQCTFCTQAKELLGKEGIEYEERNLSQSSSNWTKEKLLGDIPTARTVPQILIDDQLIGGLTELKKFLNAKIPPPLMPESWLGIGICKMNNVIQEPRKFGNSETRNENMIKLITLACQQHDVPDFEWILIHTGDHNGKHMQGDNPNGYRVDANRNVYRQFAPSSIDFYPETIPDFLYDNWAGSGVDDYEVTRKQLLALTDAPETDLLGWRGKDHHPNRLRLIQIAEEPHPSGRIMDCVAVSGQGQPRWDTYPAGMSLLEQAKRFRYLIDIEGYQGGYSGGLKLRLHAPRVVFIQERDYKEDFFEWLVPYKHYIPVKNNLSDLVERLKWLKENPDVEELIIKEKAEFCNTYLTREAAVKRIADRLRDGAVLYYKNLLEDPVPAGIAVPIRPPAPPPPVLGQDLQNPKVHEVH